MKPLIFFLLLIPLWGMAQYEVKISGTVYDDHNQPLAGVKIGIEADGNTITWPLSTNSLGQFALTVDGISMNQQIYLYFQHRCFFLRKKTLKVDQWVISGLVMQLNVRNCLEWQGRYGHEAGLKVLAIIDNRQYRTETGPGGFITFPVGCDTQASGCIPGTKKGEIVPVYFGDNLLRLKVGEAFNLQE
ncbi:MAG: carboxypeptidase-like regulatory domain-containing protein [Bacteroidota bacterium]